MVLNLIMVLKHDHEPLWNTKSFFISTFPEIFWLKLFRPKHYQTRSGSLAFFDKGAGSQMALFHIKHGCQVYDEIGKFLTLTLWHVELPQGRIQKIEWLM